MIYISSDHGGYGLKSYLVSELAKKGVALTDIGPEKLDMEDDYPEFAALLAVKVTESPENKGILICRNGVGMSIAANKYRGIRAALSWNPDHVLSSRKDDNSNVLVLPADYISSEEAMKIVDTWLNTPFKGEERFVRRLAKLAALEK
jgi:ribose 5-phosphate isomerase B